MSWLGCTLGALVLCVASAQGQDRFRETYDRAFALYSQQHFPEALAAFQEAYDIQPDPMLLLSLAKVHLKLGQAREAKLLCERYLRAVPRPPRRTQQKVNEYLAQALQLLAQEGGRPEAPPVLPAAPAQAVMPAQAGPEPQARPTELSGPRVVEVTPRGERNSPPTSLVPFVAMQLKSSGGEGTPLRRRWWLWSLVGVATAGAVTGVVLGVLYRQQEPTRYPNHSDLNF